VNKFSRLSRNSLKAVGVYVTSGFFVFTNNSRLVDVFVFAAKLFHEKNSPLFSIVYSLKGTHLARMAK